MNINDYLHYYTKEEIETIATGLSSILAKYDGDMVASGSDYRLPDKLIDILQVVLSLTEHYAENYRHSNINHAQYKSASQLQHLKDELVRTQSRHLDISFKIPGKAFKIDDPIVSKWIRDQLIKAFDKFDIPAAFGEAMFLLDSKGNPLQHDDKPGILESYASRPMSFAKAVYLFCESMMINLRNMFTLAPHEAKYLSETQISFLYEVLALVGFDTFNAPLPPDDKPQPTERDRLYTMLNSQHKLKH
jgi:hypothetical protein